MSTTTQNGTWVGTTRDVTSELEFQICTYFLLKASVVIPEVTSRVNRSILPYSSVLNLEEAKFMNFEKS